MFDSVSFFSVSINSVLMSTWPDFCKNMSIVVDGSHNEWHLIKAIEVNLIEWKKIKEFLQNEDGRIHWRVKTDSKAD